MKRVLFFSAVAILLILIVLIALFIVYPASLNENKKEQKPFYVGVTYCGNTTAEAKLLIDKVKSYTNLFVLQSGVLQAELNKMEEICDYAVTSGLNIIVYFGAIDSNQGIAQSFIDIARARWGSHFLGMYYGDEPGGKMLDSNLVTFNDKSMGEMVTRQPGSLVVTKVDGTTIFYNNFNNIQITCPNGTWVRYLENGMIDWDASDGTSYKYYPNGTITKSKTNGGNGTAVSISEVVIDKNDAPQVGTYEEAWAARPFQTYDEAAARLVDHCQSTTEWLRNQSVTLFTSDYSLYWFDYLGGYDIVFAELGWNHTTAQDIALVRGAANLQNKSWGTIVTWKYTEPPYLGNGDEIYNQLRMVYEGGAKYAVIFNYPTIEGNQYGVLQDEHFQALERFWNEVVQNPKEINGEVKAEAALVLPKNYGWGMRTSNDTIWGMWPTDNKSQQIWTLLQNNLAQYGSRLDIVYDDPAYPVAGKYQQIYYWNQTS